MTKLYWLTLEEKNVVTKLGGLCKSQSWLDKNPLASNTSSTYVCQLCIQWFVHISALIATLFLVSVSCQLRDCIFLSFVLTASSLEGVKLYGFHLLLEPNSDLYYS